MLIESGEPKNWRELEERVAQILNECGMEVESPKTIETVRGSVEVDVFARDVDTTPDSVYLCECKYWDCNVSRAAVHAFRTVVSDSGANTGLAVAKLGFQPGAIEAASHSNVSLLSWPEFQDLFAVRWLVNHMIPLARRELHPLIEYTEPVNSRILRKADQLSPEAHERLKELRKEHSACALLFMLMTWNPGRPMLHRLPLRGQVERDGLPELEGLPSDVLDEVALRPFFTAVFSHAKGVVAEFDEVFGERA